MGSQNGGRTGEILFLLFESNQRSARSLSTFHHFPNSLSYTKSLERYTPKIKKNQA